MIYLLLYYIFSVGWPVLSDVRQGHDHLRALQQGLDQGENIPHAQEAGQQMMNIFQLLRQSYFDLRWELVSTKVQT